MAAALRSSVGHDLRFAAATAPASSRLSSAGAASANARVHRMHYGNYNGSRSMFDAEAYSRNPVPANPEMDKFDCFFTAAAIMGSFVVACLMEGEGIGGPYFGWCKENTARQPRMSTGGGRRR